MYRREKAGSVGRSVGQSSSPPPPTYHHTDAGLRKVLLLLVGARRWLAGRAAFGRSSGQHNSIKLLIVLVPLDTVQLVAALGRRVALELELANKPKVGAPLNERGNLNRAEFQALDFVRIGFGVWLGLVGCWLVQVVGEQMGTFFCQFTQVRSSG